MNGSLFDFLDEPDSPQIVAAPPAVVEEAKAVVEERLSREFVDGTSRIEGVPIGLTSYEGAESLEDVDADQVIALGGEIAEEIWDGDEIPVVVCPRCGAKQRDADGFGVLFCAACNYCSHASVDGDTRNLCGLVVRAPEAMPTAPLALVGPLAGDEPETGSAWLGGEIAKPDDLQPALFEKEPSWKDLWVGMPEFAQKDLTPWQTVPVHFRNERDRNAFAELIGQTITDVTKSVWFPKAEISRYVDKRFKTARPVNPRYPVYVPTKGRYDSALTIKALEKLGIPYYAVVQPQEEALYRPVVKTGEILLLPTGLDGLVPARNWIKDHSIEVLKAERHWQIDDNIDGFYRLYQNLKVPVATGAIFRAMEDFSDRYENVAISGPNYFMFASRKTEMPPLTINTRVYSCSLVNNAIPHRWRGVYNDDTDICIRALKDGLCIVLFNAFLCMKSTTMTLGGGNTPIYQGDGRLKMAQSLADQHPDCVVVTEKWGRPQHHVDYSRFRGNKLIRRKGVEIQAGVDNYGMELEVDTDPRPIPVSPAPEISEQDLADRWG